MITNLTRQATLLITITGVDLSNILGEPKYWWAKGGNSWWKHRRSQLVVACARTAPPPKSTPTITIRLTLMVKVLFFIFSHPSSIYVYLIYHLSYPVLLCLSDGTYLCISGYLCNSVFCSKRL